MKILYKLTSAFLLMALLLGFVGYSSYKSIIMVRENFDMVNEQTIPTITSINKMRISALEIFSATSELAMFSMHFDNETSGSKGNELEIVNQNIGRYDESFSEYGRLVDAYFPGESETRDRIRAAWNPFIERINRMIAASAGNNSHDIFNEQRALENASTNLQNILNVAVLHESEELRKGQEIAQETVSNSLNFLILSIWIFAAVSIIGIMVAYNLSKSAMALRDSAWQIGKGNLSVKANITSKDELGELASTLNAMASDLKKSRDDTKKSNTVLSQKVLEMTEAKAAMQNMMEDAEETNRELIKAREKLNANIRELKALDVKKDEFISIAAHELKTPLTAIHGFSQLLENEDVVKNAELRNNYLKVIDGETKRLSNLVTEVLDLSRIDLGVIKFSADSVNLYDIIEQIRRETGAKAKEKGLVLTYGLEKGLPNVVADREKLMQVIINLVTNAEKYTEKGSIMIRIQKAGDSIQFSVADTGIGIPKKHFPKMFSRFYQVDASYTRKVGGTGLGLSVCKEFVEGMGGRIWFESVAGKGSTFYFSLPVNKKKPKSAK